MSRPENFSIRTIGLERATFLATGALFLLSGVPALVYQTAWQRILALQTGVGAVSVATIVAAYMAGLGIGSHLGGRLSRRLGPRACLFLFAGLELSVGLFATQSLGLYGQGGILSPGGSVARMALVQFLLLLPPTCVMGMTLPLLSRALVRDARMASSRIAWLYGLNVLGAALGALLTPWVLVPRFGLDGAIEIGACCNWAVALGVAAVGILRKVPDGAEARESSGATPDATTSHRRLPLGFWMGMSAASGFAAIALEMLWFRVVDVGTKSTAYTFGTVLAVYLLGLGAGSLLAPAVLRSRPFRGLDPLTGFLASQCGILAYVGLEVLALGYLPRDTWGFDWFFRYWGGYEPIAPDGSNRLEILWLYGLFPAALFGPPTFLMGLSFAQLQAAVQTDAEASGYRVGLLQASNIVGCLAGSLLVGLWLFEALGTAETFRFVVALGAVFAACGAGLSGRPRLFGIAGALAFGLAWLMPSNDLFWARLHGQSGTARILTQEDLGGVGALINEGRWRVSVNGKGQSYIPFGGVHSKLGALPATLHPAPRDIALIGLGSGDTAWAAACRPETSTVTVFEISPSQWDLLKRVNEQANDPRLKAFLADPRVRVVGADGRNALGSSPARYDLIEADAIRPNGAYSGNLYSLEFFSLCRSRLKPGGLMCTWSPTPRTRATFLRAFPHAIEVDGGVILIGSNEPIAFDRDAWLSRIGSKAVADYLGGEVANECRLGLQQAGPAKADAPPESINTDWHPLDEYQ